MKNSQVKTEKYSGATSFLKSPGVISPKTGLPKSSVTYNIGILLCLLASSQVHHSKLKKKI